MIVKLVVASGKNAGRAIAVKRNKLLVGRAEDCDVRPLSDEVSRRHCEVNVGPAEVTAQDLGSRNGTFVNGEKIAEKTLLKDGDILRIGSLELQVSITNPAAKAGSEDDVSRWLMADDEPAGMYDTTRTVPVGGVPPARSPQESGSIHAAPVEGDTGSSFVSGIDPASSQVGDAPASDNSAAGMSTVEALKAANSKPGTLPTGNRKSADSSRDAAAVALRKFFDNR